MCWKQLCWIWEETRTRNHHNWGNTFFLVCLMYLCWLLYVQILNPQNSISDSDLEKTHAKLQGRSNLQTILFWFYLFYFIWHSGADFTWSNVPSGIFIASLIKYFIDILFFRSLTFVNRFFPCKTYIFFLPYVRLFIFRVNN